MIPETSSTDITALAAITRLFVTARVKYRTYLTNIDAE